jgi:hypothetical protein
MINIKPHWKTKIWLEVNGQKCFYYLEEDLDNKNMAKGTKTKGKKIKY